ncbi:ShlB/FhaC/HecB family hemolysin secretion/activation protein [Serratia fonticola]|uniref:ShlB/FhaC/HecB family hemolysin secretion/activation protein n=1 Tax=Serratia fonticola TaxID=47917 RepID=UPI001376C4F9|nr:ShlB/FhaC/HecB family hemolysin secretion/activation protein [Serratia fonticola]
MFAWKRWVSSLVFIASSCGGMAHYSQAAEFSPADRDSIIQRQRGMLEQAQQQREALENQVSLPTLSSPTLDLSGEACQKVHQIILQGVGSLSWSVQEQLVFPFRGRCLTLANINQLVRETTNAYLQRGFVTSQAYLKAQDISSGVLIISVSEGRIGSITLDGKETLALKMAFEGLIDRVLNLRDIEQGMEQLNRLPSQQVNIDIQPDLRPGYSNVVLLRVSKRLPLSLSLGADNSGQKSTGTGQMNVGVTLDNPLRFGDQWAFSVARNSHFNHNHRSHSFSGSMSLPYGYWQVGYYYAWSDFFQAIPFNQATYRYQGDSQTHRLSANRTLFRDGTRKFGIDIGLTRRRTENRLAGERLAVSSPTISSLSFGGNYSAVLGQGYLTFNPTISHGLSMLGATADDPQHRDLPRSKFRKFSLSTSYFHPLVSSLSYLASAYGQTTPDNLYSSERISVGGQYSVRGFREQYLTGNRGAYWRNELSWRLGLGDLTLIGALDSGWVQGRAGRIDGGNVTGAAVGAVINSRWFGQSFTFGKPLRYPESLQPDRWVAYWQATVTL